MNQNTLALMLKLIDILSVGLQSVPEIFADFAKLRTQVGQFVVENRSPTKAEFDSLMQKGDALTDQVNDKLAEMAGDDGVDETDEDGGALKAARRKTLMTARLPRHEDEDPATHVMPAYLKSDVLRAPGRNLDKAVDDTSSQTTAHAQTRQSAMFDPYALENQKRADPATGEREGSGTQEPQTARRFQSFNHEHTAHIEGSTQRMKPKVGINPDNNDGGTGSGSAGDAPPNPEDPAFTSGEAGGKEPQKKTTTNAAGGKDPVTDDDGEQEPDFEATTVSDLKEYLTTEDVTYEEGKLKAYYVDLAKKTYDSKKDDGAEG